MSGGRPAPSLRRRLFFALLGLALIPLGAASWMAVTTTAQALRDKIGTYSRQLVVQLSHNLDAEFAKVKTLTDDVLISPEISSRMVGYHSSGPADRAMTRFIFNKLLQLKFLNVDYVDDVALVVREGAGQPVDLIHTSSPVVWPDATLTTLTGAIPVAGEVRNLGLTLANLPGTNRRDLVLVRPVRNALADETLGHLVVALDPEYFARLLKGVDLGAGGDLFIVDPKGRLMAGRRADRAPGTQAIPSEWLTPDVSARPFLRTWEGQEHLFATASLGTTGWTVVGAIPSSYLDSETGKIATQVTLFSLAALVVALLVSLRIAERFTAPLRNLEKTMGLFGEGVMQARTVIARDDELGRLQRTFNAMADDITGLMAKIDEEHRALQLSELQVLEYQINPHFLYNTLDSINWMALRAEQKEISAMVTALARFFRLSLSRGREVYRVRDELDHARAFLSISRMRYPDCFGVEEDVDPSILERHTLKIVLQPLVENAIKHGINKKATDGLIRISGHPVAGGFEWVVTDNGKGMSSERVVQLQQRLDGGQPEGEGPGGFGLVNVSHRIRLNYGPGYGLRVTSEPGVGTSVRVLLPWDTEDRQ